MRRERHTRVTEIFDQCVTSDSDLCSVSLCSETDRWKSKITLYELPFTNCGNFHLAQLCNRSTRHRLILFHIHSHSCNHDRGISRTKSWKPNVYTQKAKRVTVKTQPVALIATHLLCKNLGLRVQQPEQTPACQCDPALRFSSHLPPCFTFVWGLGKRYLWKQRLVLVWRTAVRFRAILREKTLLRSPQILKNSRLKWQRCYR